jgi:hypothetical protein
MEFQDNKEDTNSAKDGEQQYHQVRQVPLIVLTAETNLVLLPKQLRD